MNASDRRLMRTLIDDVKYISGEIHSLRNEQKPTPSLDIPPLWIRKAALSFQGFTTWSPAYKILCDYYGIPPIDARIDASKVSENAIACFRRDEICIFSKDKIMNYDTGIHEFFHYLCFRAGKLYEEGPSEAMTNAYVQEFMRDLK